MMTEKAKQRLRILTFWENHGTAPTCDAFGVSRRTLYRWKAVLKQANGEITALIPKSTTANRKPQLQTPAPLVAEIKHLRTRYPNLGKTKLHVLLRPWCTQHGIPLPSASTIGRIIARDPDKMRLPPR